MRAWLIHWFSAALALVMLLTALPLTGLLIMRPSTRVWADIHLTLGWTLVSLTLVRLVIITFARGNVLPTPNNFEFWRAILKAALLATMAFILITGAVIYRPSPLQEAALVFGLVKAGAIISLDHILHLQIITLHRYASYVLVVLIALHGCFAFKRLGTSGSRPISWLWFAAWHPERRSICRNDSSNR